MYVKAIVEMCLNGRRVGSMESLRIYYCTTSDNERPEFQLCRWIRFQGALLLLFSAGVAGGLMGDPSCAELHIAGSARRRAGAHVLFGVHGFRWNVV